jgi:hypothetical protein
MFGIFYIHVDYIHHKQLLNAFVCHMGVTYLDATHMFGHFLGGYHTFSAHHVYIVSPFLIVLRVLRLKFQIKWK